MYSLGWSLSKKSILIDSGPVGAVLTCATVSCVCMKAFRATRHASLSTNRAVKVSWGSRYLTDGEKPLWYCNWCFPLKLLQSKRQKKKKKKRKRPPYLSDKSLSSGWAHEEHSSAKCVPVAVQLFDSHCSEQTCDHHVDIRFHLLKGYIHSLLGGPV